MIKTGLIVFVKNPELGKVKTRLAQSVGDQEALRIYIELLNHTRRVTSEIEVTRFLFYAEHIAHGDAWSGQLYEKRLQSPGGLGKRMSMAFAECFKSCDRVLIIGSDCASLTADHIREAVESLGDKNVVIGPSFDGGYYLLGMDGYYPQLFENIEWSTDTVFAETVKRIESSQLSYTTIEALSDIDYIEDWENYGW